MICRKACIISIILFAVMLAPANAAWAQANDRVDPDAAQLAVERTDEVIASAREIVKDTRSRKARIALDYAIQLQEKAKNSVSATFHNMAYQLTMQARKEAWHAINLARTDARQEERLKRVAERTMEKLVSLRARIAETGLRDQRTMRLMHEARDQLDKASVNHQQLRGELALKLAENAYRLAGNAEESFRRALNLMEMCRRRLTLLERLADRARSNAAESGNDGAGAQLRRAEEQIARAHDMFSAGRYDACRMNLEKAERMLRNIVRSTSETRPDDPARMLEEALTLLDRAEEIVADQPGQVEEPEALIDRARRMLERAGSEIAAGKEETAVSMIGRARGLLRKAVDLIRVEFDPDRTSVEIERAAETGERAEALLGECGAREARNLYERAQAHLEGARRYFDAGRLERAVAEARIARNLFNRIGEICAR
jgi:hypothetical protein